MISPGNVSWPGKVGRLEYVLVPVQMEMASTSTVYGTALGSSSYVWHRIT